MTSKDPFTLSIPSKSCGVELSMSRLEYLHGSLVRSRDRPNARSCAPTSKTLSDFVRPSWTRCRCKTAAILPCRPIRSCVTAIVLSTGASARYRAISLNDGVGILLFVGGSLTLLDWLFVRVSPLSTSQNTSLNAVICTRKFGLFQGLSKRPVVCANIQNPDRFCATVHGEVAL